MNLLDSVVNNLKDQGKYWIVFTGDSITSCEWVHPNWRDIVIYVLQNELISLLDGDWQTAEWGIKGFNFAYDGATTKNIYDRIDDLLIVKPQLVIGLMGGNDPVLDVSVQESVKYISQITQAVTETGADIVWSNSTPAAQGSPKNSQYQPYAEALMQMHQPEHLLKLDMFNLYQKFPTDKFFTFISEENPVEGIKAGEPDLQHPNQLGNAYIAKIILDQVFGIKFNPDKYIKQTQQGAKLPSY